MAGSANWSSSESSSSVVATVDSGSGLWKPRELAFRAYAGAEILGGEGSSSTAVSSSAAASSSQKSSGLRVIVKKPLVSRLTKDIVETYQTCNPNFQHSEALNPKRFLTSPSIGVLNDGYDNANSDLILSVNLELVNEVAQRRYIVKDMLGQGTFGQVAKCLIPGTTDSYVAVKVIKNLPAYHQQALHEVNILRTLNKIDPDDKHHIVRMIDYFVYQRHLCISFEMLGSNLYELLKCNQLKGLSLSLVQMFSKQILQALVVMKDARIIHCDLKPENILLWTSIRPPGVKVIDFGSACMEGQTVYSYIQSRYYRSPEVLLGYPYTTAIDMWSFGCIVAELFLGLPLFPAASEYDLLRRTIEMIGGQPPDIVLRDSKNTSKFFKHVGSIHHLDNNRAFPHGKACAYRLLTAEEYESRSQKKPAIGKWYFNSVKLDDIVAEYPYKKNLSERELSKERITRLALIDFVRGLVEFDPDKRWTPLQASGHPFVTGEPFTCPYTPPLATPRIPVNHNITVDTGPSQGHWLAAGLSPQVNASRGFRHNSPHFNVAPHGASYGSLGSYGSYSDTYPRGSYGSYGDSNNVYGFYSPAGPSGLSIPLHFRGSAIGGSPDARAAPQYSYGAGFGLSPTATFGPMSLGVSPSQFTPPSCQIQGSSISPGKYGPTSPARGSGVHGSPLGKAAAFGQYNRRRSMGHPGTLPVQPAESASQHWQGHHVDGALSGYPESNSRGHIGSPRSANSAYQPNWTKQRGGGGFSSGSSVTIHHNLPPAHPGKPSEVSLHSSETSSDQAECSSSLPNPGDWDPNYSDELLLEESSDIGTIVSGVNSMHLGPLMDPAVRIVDRAYNQASWSSDSASLNSRSDGQVQDNSGAESSSSSLNHIQSGHPHQMPMPYHASHFPQGSSSRFGQQPGHRINHIQSSLMRGDRNYPNGQFSRPNYSATDTHSPANSAFGTGASWGHRSGHPIVATLPSSHSKR